MRIVYMGTPDFAVPALEALVRADDIDVVGVFTNPDRPRGRGKAMSESAVKRCATEHGIAVCQPVRFRGDEEAMQQLRDWAPDCAVVAAYGQILPQSALDVPRLGCVNIHASLLPKHRGAAPINWCIIHGEQVTGVCTMQMEAGLDTGPVLLRRELEIGALETAGELHDRLMVLGAELILPTLRRLDAGSIEPQPQDDRAATYAPMMSKDTGRIDWTHSAIDIANLIRGTNPWPGAWTTHRGARIKLHLAQAVADRKNDEPGTVTLADKDLEVACGTGILRCLQIQAPGGRAMSTTDFLNGYDLSVGERLV